MGDRPAFVGNIHIPTKPTVRCFSLSHRVGLARILVLQHANQFAYFALPRLKSILKELEDAVPSDLPDLREAVNHLTPLDLSTQICFYTSGVNERVGVQDTLETPCLRANRPKLRQWLATDIPIQWSKHLVSINSDDAAGRVTVEFADGTSATGDIVVGADGVNSSGL